MCYLIVSLSKVNEDAIQKNPFIITIMTLAVFFNRTELFSIIPFN